MTNENKFKVAMTPIPNGNIKTIRVEKIAEITNPSDVYLEAHGKNAGLIVNRENKNARVDNTPADMQLEFTCMMHNSVNLDEYAENRRLKFWFVEGLNQMGRIDGSYEFFKTLIDPADFPKDYASFIKKVMKQMQIEKFRNLRRVDIDFIKLNKQQQDALVPRVEEKPKELIVKENLQARLDEAYPNCLSMDDLVRILGNNETMIRPQLNDLINGGVIECVDFDGKTIGFRRKLAYHEEVTVVKENESMQKIFKKEKPTVAIITNLLCEKYAVDSMMTDKTTFVKFEGESHVYTLGRIGKHKIISTKVAMVGRELKARISSANTTTRLLGTFQDVEHVLLVGVGGSVPHVYEFDKHSRLGDIVVSYSVDKDPVYVFCEKINETDAEHPDKPLSFDIKKYELKDAKLRTVVDKILTQYENNPEKCEWKRYMDDVFPELEKIEQIKFTRPSPDTDKLKLKVSEGVTFDIKHPEVPADVEHLYPPGVPAVRLGCIGSGHPVTDSDKYRDQFAKEHHLLAYDSEYDQVLDSIRGNGVRSFMLIRAAADYFDGSKGGLWQPYSSLAAAAFMKAVINWLPTK